MGWIDDTWKRLTRRAGEEAAKATAREAVHQASRKVTGLAEGLLDEAERKLKAGEAAQARAAQAMPLPSTVVDDPAWVGEVQTTVRAHAAAAADSRLTEREQAALRHVEQGAGTRVAAERATAEERARAELERLKAARDEPEPS